MGFRALLIAVCAAWLLAPMLVSTVLYVTQRMAQLAALFTLAGLLAFTVGRRAIGRAAGMWKEHWTSPAIADEATDQPALVPVRPIFRLGSRSGMW